MYRIAGILQALIVTLLMGGCTTTGYYSQIVDGHLSLLSARTPIADLLEDPDVPSALKARLQSAQQIRDYASEVLLLPDNDSYRSYADIGRESVTWNVVATEEFSLEPETWCFWVAGCVSYRGYYEQKSAAVFAESMRDKGYDVAISGALAYSTLGWFDDPVLNTMIGGEDFILAGLIFHELAHQKLYVDDSSAFNEAFATFVEREAVRRWLNTRNSAAEKSRYAQRLQRQFDVAELLRQTRESLIQLYRGQQPVEQLRREKDKLFEKLKADYLILKQSWGGFAGYDHWFDQVLNNAHLASLETYQRWVPGFARLYEQSAGLEDFYSAATELAEMPLAQRDARLDALSALP
jgi:predicted aminopeptidase